MRLRYSMGVDRCKIEMQKNCRRLMTLWLAGGVIACLIEPREAIANGNLTNFQLEEAAYGKSTGASSGGGAIIKLST